MTATRRRRGEDGISFEHRGPCTDPHRHRHCPGLWRGELTLGYTGDGKRQRRKVSGKTKAAVIDKLRDLHAQLDKGVTPKAGYAHYTVRLEPASGPLPTGPAQPGGCLGFRPRAAWSRVAWVAHDGGTPPGISATPPGIGATC
jgi:hypothetical protein